MYHLDETMYEKHEDGTLHYYPGIAQFQVEGYHRTNYDYGTDFALASAVTDGLNLDRGTSLKCASLIAASSMFPKNRITRQDLEDAQSMLEADRATNKLAIQSAVRAKTPHRQNKPIDTASQV